MCLGTAGFTAALCFDKLEKGGISPQDGEILVTGASGGVGSLAVAMLAGSGYSVAAATGKPESADMLRKIGARRIVSREEISDDTRKPLLAQRWAGVIDTVGGGILATAIRSTGRHGVVACCGNVASAELQLTVYPFILRGVTLSGADSATSTMDTRKRLWGRLSSDWKPDVLDEISTEIGLQELDERIDRILAGRHTGRCVVRLDN